jgi:hypothetical protein
MCSDGELHNFEPVDLTLIFEEISTLETSLGRISSLHLELRLALDDMLEDLLVDIMAVRIIKFHT